MSIKSIVFASLLFCGVARAEMQILDDGHVLQDLSMWGVGASKFADEFKCGDHANFTLTTVSANVKCTSSYCISTEVHPQSPAERNFSLQIADCSEDAVNFYGDNGLSVTVTRADFATGQSTWLISLLKGLGHFIQPEGQITLKTLMPMQYSLIRSGSKNSVMGLEIRAQFTTAPGSQSEELVLVLIPSLNGIEKVALLKIGEANEFFRLKGLLDAHP